MKQFFGAFFGSVIGIVAATLLGILLIAGIIRSSIGKAISDDTQATLVSDKTILKLDMEGEIIERERENPFAGLGDAVPFVEAEKPGLNGLVRRITAATDDDKVAGIYLRFKNMRAGMATLRELRDALRVFADSGKFVYCYGEDYTQGQYYLASAGTRVFLHPEGSLDWKGLGMNLLFFKTALEKLDLEMQIFRHGKFKSAIEPFILDRMSEASRMQSEVFLGSMWQTMLAGVAASRKIDVDELQAMANELRIRFPEDAEGTLIDKIAYEDEVLDELREKTGSASVDKIAFVDLQKYRAKMEKESTDRIAVIYVNGSITSGDGSDEEAGSDRIGKAIREARTNEKVKAIVLRVNSPGGSALASDVIWREMYLTGKSKPAVVSMGDVAASGGYYISCAAERIFAQPNTITGSIGVFGVMPNFGKLLENKLGVSPDTVNTNKHSDFGSLMRQLRPEEGAFVQAMVEKVYATFTSKVAEGRGISIAAVDSIGQGRVWSGTDALEMQLVDELGGLNDAIAYAAEKADLTSYRLMELPRLKGPFDGIFNSTEKQVERRAMEASLGKMYPYFRHIAQLMKLEGVQARLPFEVVIN